ncbi:hypothetical protein P9112_002769 [Eukaryota sp. TZLM1-RC]
MANIKSHFSKKWLSALCLNHHDNTRSTFIGQCCSDRFKRQVECDVNRSMWDIYKSNPNVQKRDSELKQLRTDLSAAVLSSLSSMEGLHYYQGFHEIGETVLRTTKDLQVTTRILTRLAQFHLRHFLLPDFTCTTAYLSLVNVILEEIDPNVAKFLQDSMQAPPLFAVSWVLTWFNHVVDAITIRTRLTDFFITSSPLAPAVLSALVILHNKSVLLSGDPDFTTCHAIFSNIDSCTPWTLLMDKSRVYLNNQVFIDKVISRADLPEPLFRCLTAFPYNFEDNSDLSHSRKHFNKKDTVKFWSSVALSIGVTSAAIITQLASLR